MGKRDASRNQAIQIEVEDCEDGSLIEHKIRSKLKYTKFVQIDLITNQLDQVIDEEITIPIQFITKVKPNEDIDFGLGTCITEKDE